MKAYHEKPDAPPITAEVAKDFEKVLRFSASIKAENRVPKSGFFLTENFSFIVNRVIIISSVFSYVYSSTVDVLPQRHVLLVGSVKRFWFIIAES